MTILDLCLFIANFSFKSSITGLKLEVTELRKQITCCIQLSHPCLAASIACQSLYYCIPSPWQDINTAWPSYLRLHGAQLVLPRLLLVEARTTTTTTSHWAAAWAKNQLPARAQQWLTWRAQGDLWETWTWTRTLHHIYDAFWGLKHTEHCRLSSIKGNLRFGRSALRARAQ